MLWLPGGAVLVVFAFVTWLVWVAGNKVFYPVAAALSEALPPRASRDGYMAIYQYAFTTAQVLCPAVIALFAVSDTLPWLVVAGCSLGAVGAVAWMARSTPTALDHRLSPDRSSSPPRNDRVRAQTGAVAGSRAAHDPAIAPVDGGSGPGPRPGRDQSGTTSIRTLPITPASTAACASAARSNG